MDQNRILQFIENKKQDSRIIKKIFGFDSSEQAIKTGLSVREIITEMKKASKENLIKEPENASFGS